MRLYDKIRADMRKAIKSGNKLERAVIKMLLSEINYAQASMHSEEELDAEVIKEVVEKYYSQLKKSKATHKRQNVHDEIQIVARYLPEGPHG